MASSFKNKFVQPAGTETAFALGGSNDTVPVGSQITVIGLTCANNSAATTDVSVKIYDTHGGTGYFLIKAAPLPAGSSLSVLDGKLVLEAGNKIVVDSTDTSTVDAIISYLELT